MNDPILCNLKNTTCCIFGKYTVRIVLTSRFHRTKKPILPAVLMRPRAREIEMELAAVLLFSSVALWIAEEMNGNQL